MKQKHFVKIHIDIKTFYFKLCMLEMVCDLYRDRHQMTTMIGKITS